MNTDDTHTGSAPASTNMTAIIGAGALGAMYAGQIQRSRLPVAFVAEGERAARLRQGVRVNGETLKIPVISWDHPPVARILVAVKHGHLEDVSQRLRSSVGAGALAGPGTIVLSVMNGIDSEHVLQAALDEGLSHDSHHQPDRGAAVVLPAMAAGMDAVRSGEEIRYASLGRIFFGPPPDRPGPSSEEAVEGMRLFLEHVGIPGIIPDDITHAVWNKFMLNVGINQWSAVLRARYRYFHREGPGRDLMRAAMGEVLAVANKRGINLTREDLEGWFSVVETLAADGKTSMLQDVEAQRKTEVEMFAGRVVAMGQELDVPTPVNQCLLSAIQAIEDLYHG